jgi:hypothetical protein
MRYVLKMEAIGDSHSYHVRKMEEALRYGKPVPYGIAARVGQIYKMGHQRPWVARLTGLRDGCKIQRRFIQAQRDYSRANSSGSRGIMLYYFLEPGLYEINQRITWKRTKRYFAWIVDENTLCELSREEAVEWLQVNVR